MDASTSPTAPLDRVLTNCRVIDPANNIDGRLDVGIRAGRIAAVAPDLIRQPHRGALDLGGAVVTPGFVDVHVHVYEWVTNFGVAADAAGVHSGATTIVDQGSTGAWTFGGFKAFIVDPARTDVRAFVSINVAGALKGGMEGEALHNPGMVRVDELVGLAAAHPRVVRGFKCHGESGALSHWDLAVFLKAVEAGKRAGLPLYVHTGELFPVDETHRPSPEAVLPKVLPHLKPGDMLAHVYSSMPDGVVGRGNRVPDVVRAARDQGVLFDLGHGVNLSFRIARMMMDAGIYPDTIGSDVHGDFNSYHDLSILDYSLAGAVNKLLALGMSLGDVIARVTAAPARFLGDATIGALTPGNPADLTVLERVDGDWTFRDSEGERIAVTARWVPRLVIKDGDVIVPDCGLLSDLLPADGRPLGVTRPFAGVQQAAVPARR
ncbi:MAG: amidohydrolase family protein [Proteobacteria bacterium]|nr:amidohydrolase family protein [Pseudomonadota bacterium]